MSEPLLDLKAVKIHFPVRGGLLQRPVAWVKAVDDVSLTIEGGDTLGLVGESGSGKTTIANGIAMLQPLTAGKIRFRGQDLSETSRRTRQQLRSSVQIVFQDPFWSLNPRWLVRDIVGEPLKVHKHLHGDAYQNAAVVALEMVGLGGEDLFKYPHEFAGGVRQRVAIARALAIRPDLVILDEPTSAIDVLSQHQILLMLQDLKQELGLTYILVSHDLSVVGYLATKIAVMYAGRLMEWGLTEDVFDKPLHPYTQALFASIPDHRTAEVDALFSMPGDVASVLNPPEGCRFHPRCPEKLVRCSQQEPPQVDVGAGHCACCWLLEGRQNPASMGVPRRGFAQVL